MLKIPSAFMIYYVDAKGILNVSAKDKSTGKPSQITIKSEKGSMSKNEGDRSVQEAARYRDGHEQNKTTIDDEKDMHSFCSAMRNTLQEDKVKETYDGDAKKVLEGPILEALNKMQVQQQQLTVHIQSTV